MTNPLSGVDILSYETLAQIKASMGSAQYGWPGNYSEDIAKAFTTGTGLTWYDLQAPSKFLVPILTPLRNRIPRVKGNGDVMTHWKSITGLNTGGLQGGIPEGMRSAVTSTNVVSNTATYKTIGLDEYVTIEAQLAAVGLEDLRATAARNLLLATMQIEERLFIGGNTSIALGQCGTVSTSTATTGGSLPASTEYFVACVMMTAEGLNLANFGNSGVPVAQSSLVDATGASYTVNGGVGQASAIANVTTGSGTATNTITFSVTPKAGAVAYAWYVGTSTGLANMHFQSITSVSTATYGTITSTGTNVGTAFSADYSEDQYVYDGLLSYAMNASNNAYTFTGTGTAGLTANGAGGITEFDNALKSLWDVSRLGPSEILVNSQEANNIVNKIIAGGSAPLARFILEPGDAGVVGSVRLKAYLNKFTNEIVPVTVHPNMPAGTVLMNTERLPYPVTNIPRVLEFRSRQDYYQVEWPMRTRKYESGVYCDGVLIHYAPFAMAVLTNIANA